MASAVLVAVLVWSYGEPILGLVRRWWNEQDYVYGFLVPVFAGYLLWLRRVMLAGVAWKGSWWGLPLLVVAGAMRWTSSYFYYGLVDPLSLVPCLLGLVLLAGGWKVLRWAWPAIFFLVFMVPLPGFVAGALSHPLQRIGTIMSTYIIQTVGIPSVAQGNVIVLSQAELGVAEACSGLRMMMLFAAVSVGAALMVRRSAIEKLVIVASAVPIAILANVARITGTAMLYETAGEKWGEAVFHDLAGWFMMPLAVALLWIEMALLSQLLVDRVPVGPVTVGVPSSGGSPRPLAGRRRKRRSKKVGR